MLLISRKSLTHFLWAARQTRRKDRQWSCTHLMYLLAKDKSRTCNGFVTSGSHSSYVNGPFFLSALMIASNIFDAENNIIFFFENRYWFFIIRGYILRRKIPSSSKDFFLVISAKFFATHSTLKSNRDRTGNVLFNGIFLTADWSLLFKYISSYSCVEKN